MQRGLDDPDLAVRAASLEALALFRGAPGAEVTHRLVRVASQDPRWPLRLRAVRALARLDDRGAVAALAAVLRDDAFAYVREAAALALRGKVAARAAVRAAAARDPDPSVRRAAASVLAGPRGARRPPAPGEHN
jgi:HEAT repeat protein